MADRLDKWGYRAFGLLWFFLSFGIMPDIRTTYVRVNTADGGVIWIPKDLRVYSITWEFFVVAIRWLRGRRDVYIG